MRLFNRFRSGSSVRQVVELNGLGIQAFLSGESFSNGLQVQVPTSTIRGRIQTLADMAKNKSVVHFGYCDHLPLVQKKMAKGKWLHSVLSDCAERCIGLDIDADAVAWLKTECHINNGHKFDLFTDELPDVVQESAWDLLIMGEILEHVDDPVQFLKQIASRFASRVRKLVVSVPNAYDLTSHQFLKCNSECLNSDHRYWFTPYTLRKVAYMSGFRAGSVHMCDEAAGHSRKRARILKKTPIMAETLVGVFEFPDA